MHALRRGSFPADHPHTFADRMHRDGLPLLINSAARRYARFVDSGITDNLGPRALLVTAEVVGAPAAPALPR
jgi:hypothetical protein